jgi:hypothetical protein
MTPNPVSAGCKAATPQRSICLADSASRSNQAIKKRPVPVIRGGSCKAMDSVCATIWRAGYLLAFVKPSLTWSQSTTFHQASMYSGRRF